MQILEKRKHVVHIQSDLLKEKKVGVINKRKESR